jgi:DNA-binding PadR family transcriptional regulator
VTSIQLVNVPLALLGLLTVADLHGYDLKQLCDRLLSPGRQIKQGQVYATLHRLERDGNIAVVGIEQEEGPERRRFALTDRGRNAVGEWLETPEPAAPYLQPPFGGTRGNERDWLHYTLGMYYTLLNTGARHPPTAGTANGVHPVPAGFSRVYVPLPDGFDYDRWLAGLRAGRSFVTTGPMLFARVEGKHPGETFHFDGESELSVAVEVVSEQPLSFGEIVGNGIPRHLLRPQNEQTPEGAFRSWIEQTVTCSESGWLAVRVWEDRSERLVDEPSSGSVSNDPRRGGLIKLAEPERPEGRFRFAHTAPWYVTIGDEPVRLRREEKRYLVQRMQAEIDRSRHVLPAEALVEYERALDHYQGLPVRDDTQDIQAESRRPQSEDELREWLENTVRHHRYTPEEIRLATGLSDREIAAALERFSIEDQPAPLPNEGTIRVLPYPGGRHPRTGFLDGAVHPQRDTKISIFLPWEGSGYVVADVPEAIFSNLGLTYLAHTHIPTIWDRQGIGLPPVEWERREDGSCVSERTLPNGIRFGTRVTPERTSVRMELWLHNGTQENLTGLRVQNCLMLKGAPRFHAQTNQNKLLAPPFAAVRAEDGRRWIITAWTPNQRTWANPPVPCLHSDPVLPDCVPGQTVRATGRLWFYEGDEVEAEIDRLRNVLDGGG